MSEIENQVETTVDDDAILPEGWADGDDIFDDSSWAGAGNSSTEEPDGDFFAETDTGASSTETPAAETTETSEGTTTPEDEGSEETGDGTAETPPAQEPETVKPPAKIKFKATVDHQDVEAEVDENEIPVLYQKAQVVDRVQAKLAKLEQDRKALADAAKELDFESPEAMITGLISAKQEQKIEELVQSGIHPKVAEFMVRKGTTIPQLTEEPSTAAQEEPASAPERDFKSEVEQLLNIHPELIGQQLPPEVFRDCAVNGISLPVAYANYEARTAKESAEAQAKANAKLQKELAVEKHNSAAAAKAPVRGTAKGGKTNYEPDDDLISGFDSDQW